MAAQVYAQQQQQQQPPIFRLDGIEDQEHSQNARPGEYNLPIDHRSRPSQLALPLRSGRDSHSHTALTFGTRHGGLRQAVAQEDLLRRKTPGGILAGAYDGAPTGTSLEGIHATKHLVLQDSARQAYNRPPSTYHMASAHLPMDLSGANTGATANHWSPYNVHATGSQQWPASLDHGPPDPRTDISSNSYTTRGLQFDQFGRRQVMQPPVQTPIGPTVSNELGPYGPYWPNGTFVPYRPASARDQQWTPGGYSDYSTRQQALQPPRLDFSWQTQNEGHQKPYDAAPQAHAQRDLAYPDSGLDYHTSRDPETFDLSAARLKQSQARRDQPGWVDTSMNSTYNVHNQPTVDPEALLRTAHQFYDRLVAAVHSARKKGRRHSQPGSRRPEIYPMPARRASLSTRCESAGPGSSHQQHGQYPFHKSHQTQPSFTQFPEHPSSHVHSQHANPPSRVAAGQSYRHNGSFNYFGRPTQHLAQSSDNFSNMQVDCPDPTTPAAWSILAALNDVIVLGGKRWIDGMQLAGCISYVLGDYESALDWNRTIIDLEPDHVEAASNLAATLLALGRREEAVSRWRHVVKLKPAHFEAVEHLVGVLCFDNRHRDAIQIIDYVQQSLRKHDDHSHTLKNSNNNHIITSIHHQASQNTNLRPRYSTLPQDNGRLMALIHAKGNVLYNLRDHVGAAQAFEEVVLLAVGQLEGDITELVKDITAALSRSDGQGQDQDPGPLSSEDMVLLNPEKALETVRICFPPYGYLPGLMHLPSAMALKAAVSVTSNSLLSLAKIFQDNMNPSTPASAVPWRGCKVQDILALYYLSLSLQPSPSIANNVGILMASVEPTPAQKRHNKRFVHFAGVIPGSGVALALEYYKYGLGLDSKHAHLFTNLGSLLKDIGQLPKAIQMYEQAVACDSNFDIALANLANAIKDQGKVNEAIVYYKRAVAVNPKFSEAVCGLANALNSVCNWSGRGGALIAEGQLDRWHVGDSGDLIDALQTNHTRSGWIKRVVEIVDTQLKEGESWGKDLLRQDHIDVLSQQVVRHCSDAGTAEKVQSGVMAMLQSWAGNAFAGARIVRLVERSMRQICWQWYQDKYVLKKEQPLASYLRPSLPSGMMVPSAPTVLPFHTFTFPMTAKQIRLISQRNGLRVSCSTLKSPWLPKTVFRPPAPPSPVIIVGYVSSDFNNHPLAHLMQSVFGMHDPTRIKAICYATTPSDNSIHRQQIEREAPIFRDASSWPVERVVSQIVEDGCHILVNLNGYTRGARNEIFAARPAPVQMSFMGFAGSLGAEWCDYLLADEVAVPPSVLRPHRSSVSLGDLAVDDTYISQTTPAENTDWVYAENIVYTRATFFCCDHAQSSASKASTGTFANELSARARMRLQLFPDLPLDTVILANFNQLYKIDPTTFRTWLRILGRLPNSVLWLLRFPEAGEAHLRRTAYAWAGAAVANRIRFTDVAPKAIHISRAAAADLFLDTPECNAHTTAADCLWSGTPLLTLPRYKWKMCSRMAASILAGSLGVAADAEGRAAQLKSGDDDVVERVRAWQELVAQDEDDYEAIAIRLGESLRYTAPAARPLRANEQHPGIEQHDAPSDNDGECSGRLAELRHILWKARTQRKTAALFDTRRWVADLDCAYEEVWRRWEKGQGGDIWLRELCGEL